MNRLRTTRGCTPFVPNIGAMPFIPPANPEQFVRRIPSRAPSVFKRPRYRQTMALADADRLEERQLEGDESPTAGEALRLDAKKSSDVRQSCKLLREAVALEPNNGRAWQDLAKAEGRLKRSKRASIAVLRNALNENRGNPYLWQSLGFLLYKTRHYDEARRHFETGIEKDPQHEPLYGTYAQMEATLGNFSKARELYSIGAKVTDARARIYHDWGQMELQTGNERRAVEIFEMGLALEPHNAYIWHTLGSMARSEGNVDHARYCFKQALVFNLDNVVILNELAKLEAFAQNYSAARELFGRGVEADGKDVRILHSWSVFEYQVRNG